MAITPDHVREILKGLETGDGAAFFENVAEDVDRTVMGTHSLAGHYPKKRAFREGTFAKLGKVLPHGAQLHCGAPVGPGRRGGSRASFFGNREERHAF